MTQTQNISFFTALICCLLCMNSFSVRAQTTTCSGKLIDAETKKPLAFVNVIVEGYSTGTTTDLEGTFKLNLSGDAQNLVFSYVGYEKKKIKVWSGYREIELKPSTAVLEEVVITPGKNPADSLIELAVKNKKHNNPKNYDQYVYEMYNKILVSVDDSAAEKLAASKDTSDQEFGEHLKKHELFLSETYSQNKYKKPGREREDIIANRVSGLKNPSFYFLATQFQPFSFYERHINLGSKTYLNPVSRNSNKDYLFILKDTLYRGSDTVFVIRYQPKKDRRFKALEGIISINTDGYAVENVIAQSAQDKVSPLQIRQKYEKVKGKWFPRQLDFDVEFAEVEINGFTVNVEGNSRIKNVAFDTALRRRDFSSITTSLEPDAHKKSDTAWDQLRGDTLPGKQSNTYHFNDSVGDEADLDEKMLILESLVTQKIPIKIFDIDLNSIVNYNLYEGFRLGAGVYTNNKLSRYISGGGYFAYGFKDKTSKFGGRLDVKFKKNDEIKLRLNYAQDVLTPGYQDFSEKKKSLFDSDLIPLFVTQMNRVETYGGAFSFPALRYGKITAFARMRSIGFTNQYRIYESYEALGDYFPVRAYNTTEAGFNLRYSFAEKRSEMFNTVMTTETPNPVFHLGYTRGFADLPEEFDDYHKFRIRAAHRHLSQRMKRTVFHVEGSYVEGRVPLTEQFGIRSSFAPNLPVFGHNAFQTVRFGQYFSDLLFQGFFEHEFIKFRTGSKTFSPSLSVFQAAAWGINVTERPAEAGWQTDTPEHGLFESGLIVNDLYKSSPDSFLPAGYGLGFFYRYGAYNRGPFWDNFAVKLTVTGL